MTFKAISEPVLNTFGHHALIILLLLLKVGGLAGPGGPHGKLIVLFPHAAYDESLLPQLVLLHVDAAVVQKLASYGTPVAFAEHDYYQALDLVVCQDARRWL